MCVSVSTNRRLEDQESGMSSLPGVELDGDNHLVVKHEYTDHSNEERPADDTFERFARSGAVTAFPIKLYDMLESVGPDGLEHVCSWAPHGRCFVVHKPEEFQRILPRYFKLSKIASFQRQLNLYGFRRLVGNGPDKGGYYHEYFLRGMPWLIQRMNRVKVKGTLVRARSNPEQEPQFWKMPFVKSTAQEQPRQEEKKVQPLVTSSASFSTIEPTALARLTRKHEEAEVRPSPNKENQAEQEIVLSGWGNPFFYLGSISQEPILNPDCALIGPQGERLNLLLPDSLAGSDEEFKRVLDNIFFEDLEDDFATMLERAVM